VKRRRRRRRRQRLAWGGYCVDVTAVG
jgi:hypothetical protein